VNDTHEGQAVAKRGREVGYLNAVVVGGHAGDPDLKSAHSFPLNWHFVVKAVKCMVNLISGLQKHFLA